MFATSASHRPSTDNIEVLQRGGVCGKGTGAKNSKSLVSFRKVRIHQSGRCVLPSRKFGTYLRRTSTLKGLRFSSGAYLVPICKFEMPTQITPIFRGNFALFTAPLEFLAIPCIIPFDQLGRPTNEPPYAV